MVHDGRDSRVAQLIVGHIEIDGSETGRLNDLTDGCHVGSQTRKRQIPGMIDVNESAVFHNDRQHLYGGTVVGKTCVRGYTDALGHHQELQLQGREGWPPIETDVEVDFGQHRQGRHAVDEGKPAGPVVRSGPDQKVSPELGR